MLSQAAGTPATAARRERVWIPLLRTVPSDAPAPAIGAGRLGARMEWAAAILGVAIGTFFGWSLAGWLEGRNQAEIRRFYDDLDEIRTARIRRERGQR